jgi:hypothetical protein
MIREKYSFRPMLDRCIDRDVDRCIDNSSSNNNNIDNNNDNNIDRISDLTLNSLSIPLSNSFATHTNKMTLFGKVIIIYFHLFSFIFIYFNIVFNKIA